MILSPAPDCTSSSVESIKSTCSSSALQYDINANPNQPSLYFELAKTLLCDGNYQGSLTAAKHFISLSRRRHRTSGEVPDHVVIAQAYFIMGEAYESLGKAQKATACYTLSFKFDSSPDAREAIERLQPKNVTYDIEDVLSHHHIKSYDEKFIFHCTMCGECCRTSDYILLTPLDIFYITRYESNYFVPDFLLRFYRSPAMAHQGITNTRQLLSSATYKVL